MSLADQHVLVLASVTPSRALDVRSMAYQILKITLWQLELSQGFQHIYRIHTAQTNLSSGKYFEYNTT